MKDKTEYDVIVAGTGIGGATVAREMTRRGKKVLLLEKGGRTDMLGNTLSVALILQNFGLLRSREKNVVTMADNYGGLSNLTAGCAAPPPPQVFDKTGIDLSREKEEARTDMKIQEQPDELIGATNLRLLDTACDMGYQWQKMEKFIDCATCQGTGNCMLGCKTGAKFSARTYGDEAIAGGAELKLRTRVTNIIVENGRAVGVEAQHLGRKVTYHGKFVVLSTGVGNAFILRNAGIRNAGDGFCCDWLQFVFGKIPGLTSVGASPMAVGSLEHYESDGIAIMPVFPNWSQFLVMLGMGAPRSLPKFLNFPQYTGIMVKVRDDIAGSLDSPKSFSKPMTDNDLKKINKGAEIIKKILIKAGAKETSIAALPPTGAHPSATCRIGEVVDTNLETEIPGLYCCDASVFPASLGLPVVWTVASLGKRLAGHLEKALS